MTNKVQKIREKIEKKLEVMQYQVHRTDAYKELKYVLDYIDSLQKEPVSEELEEAADDALNSVLNTHEIVNVRSCLEMFRLGAKWQKEKDKSTTEDLGEYINELSKQFPEVSFAKLSRIAVRVAKWQKQQDQETIELAEDHAMFAGMNKMEQQLMAKAIDAELYSDGMFVPLIGLKDKEKVSDIKFGDKVKVIIIKEN